MIRFRFRYDGKKYMLEMKEPYDGSAYTHEGRKDGVYEMQPHDVDVRLTVYEENGVVRSAELSGVAVMALGCAFLYGKAEGWQRHADFCGRDPVEEVELTPELLERAEKVLGRRRMDYRLRETMTQTFNSVAPIGAYEMAIQQQYQKPPRVYPFENLGVDQK